MVDPDGNVMRHSTGQKYEWEHPLPPAPAQTLLELARGPRPHKHSHSCEYMHLIRKRMHDYIPVWCIDLIIIIMISTFFSLVDLFCYYLNYLQTGGQIPAVKEFSQDSK